MLEILPVRGIGDVRPDDDLAELITGAAPWLRDGDVVVVTSKIVSKSEGRLVDVPTDGPEREAARGEALQAETARVVARRGPVRIVQTHHGFVMAAAGIDESNVDRSQLVLLPKDPDASARALRAALHERAGVDVAVVVSDTMGRPWRLGQIDVALGAAGIEALRDYRGEVDPYGNELHVTQVAVIDELAAAAELVKGKCEGIPVAVVRGLAFTRPADDGPAYDRLADDRLADDGPADDGPGAAVLVRGGEDDMFALGTAEARALGLRDAAALADGATRPDPESASDSVDSDSAASAAVDRDAVARAFALVAPVAAATTVFTGDGDTITCTVAGTTDPAGTTDAAEATRPAVASALVALGVDVQRLRAALLAEGVASSWHPASGTGTGSLGTIRLSPVSGSTQPTLR